VIVSFDVNEEVEDVSDGEARPPLRIEELKAKIDSGAFDTTLATQASMTGTTVFVDAKVDVVNSELLLDAATVDVQADRTPRPTPKPMPVPSPVPTSVPSPMPSAFPTSAPTITSAPSPVPTRPENPRPCLRMRPLRRRRRRPRPSPRSPRRRLCRRLLRRLHRRCPRRLQSRRRCHLLCHRSPRRTRPLLLSSSPAFE